MFKVFTEEELNTIREWIDSLSPTKPKYSTFVINLQTTFHFRYCISGSEDCR